MALPPTQVGNTGTLDVGHTRVNVHNGQVAVTDHAKEVALGNTSGWSSWNKFGYNTDITTTAPEIVAAFGGTWNPPTAAETLDVVSTSTNDTSAGTGARSVLITGIDENRDIQQEVVQLNGTTPVTTSLTWYGINRCALYLVGSGGGNEGTISIVGNTSTDNYAAVPAGEGTTQQCIFHVPSNYTFLPDWIWLNVRKLSGGTAPRVTVKGWVYAALTGARYEVFRANIDTAVENTVQVTPKTPFPVGENQVLWFEADTTANGTTVSVRFSGELVQSE